MDKARTLIAASSLLALAACIGGNGAAGGAGGGTGGGGGGGGGSSDLAARQQAIFGLGVTTDLPVSGRGNYEGQVQVTMPGAPFTAQGDVDVVGDVSLEVDFADGNASTLDGIAQNFQGTLADGTTSSINGSLILTPSLSSLSRTTLPAPVNGSTGGLTAVYEGALDFEGTTADVDLSLQGQAFGSNAAAFTGAANASVDFAPGDGTDFIAQGGIFVLERQ